MGLEAIGQGSPAEPEKKIDAHKENLIHRLGNYHRLSGKDWNEIAAEILALAGYKCAGHSLATWISREGYPGDGPLSEAVEKYLAKNDAAFREPVLLSSGKKHWLSQVDGYVREAVKVASKGKITLLCGAAGIGKTQSVLREWERIGGHTLCVQMGMGSKAFVQAMLKALGLNDMPGSVWKLSEFIIGFLCAKKKTTVLFIDECNHLNLRCLEILRYIWDQVEQRQAGLLGVVMIGTDKLIYTLDRISRESRLVELEQFKRRIEYMKFLPGFDSDKLDEVVQDRLGKVPERVMGRIRTWAGNEASLSIGRVTSLLEAMERIAEGGEITFRVCLQAETEMRE